MAAPAARVSAFPAGHLLFVPLAGRGARLNQALVRRHRPRAPPSWQPGPRVAVLDAQSINCSERDERDKGLNGHKRIQGRSQPVAGTGGLRRAAYVGPAHGNDRASGQVALQNLAQQGCERRNSVLADADDSGQPPAQWTRDHCGWRLETAPGLPGRSGFTPVPSRWVVERSSGWLQWNRRSSHDHECEISAAEVTSCLPSIRHLIHKS